MSSIDSKSSSDLNSKKKHVLLIKIIAMLSVVRWYNILLMVIALYLSSMYILNPKVAKVNY